MNRQGTKLRPSDNRAFTLLELLVAMAVMTMALTLLLSVSSGTLTTTRLCNQTMDATAQARAVLDALESDFSNLVAGRGLTLYGSQIAGSNANAELAFLTQGRGPSTSSRLMGVGYQLSADGAMNRFSNAAAWDQPDLASQALGALTQGTSSTVGKGILRFSACAVLDNGSIVSFTDSGTQNTWKIATGSRASTSFFGMNLSDSDVRRVRALLIGVVVVDEPTYQQLQKNGKLNQAIAAFPAPTMSGTSAINTPGDWAASLSNRNNENLNALPPSALAAIQVLQSTLFFH